MCIAVCISAIEINVLFTLLLTLFSILIGIGTGRLRVVFGHAPQTMRMIFRASFAVEFKAQTQSIAAVATSVAVSLNQNSIDSAKDC